MEIMKKEIEKKGMIKNGRLKPNGITEIEKKGMIKNGRLKPNGITTFKTSYWST